MRWSSNLGRSKLARRIGSAAIAAGVAGIFFGVFGAGVVSWGSPMYWVFLALIFVVALMTYGKID